MTMRCDWEGRVVDSDWIVIVGTERGHRTTSTGGN